MRTGHKEDARRQGRFSISQKKYIFLSLMFFLFFSLVIVRTASAQYLNPSKKFVLRGDITLDYERRWNSLGQSADRFQHSYTLELEGFVFDPRLISFDLNTNFTQYLPNPGTAIDSYGINLGVDLLNVPIRRGVLSYFPQPIRLRFSYFTGTDMESQSYGISLVYKREGALRLFHDGKIISLDKSMTVIGNNAGQTGGANNGNLEAPRKGFAMLFPLINLDYDRYFYKSGDVTTDIDMFSLRAESTSLHWVYKAEYDYQKYGGDSDSKSQYLTLRADYHLLSKDAQSWTDIYNSLLFNDVQDIQTVQFTNSTRWSTRLGPAFRDNLVLGGGGDYFKAESFSSYGLNASAMYSKILSERTTNTANANILFSERDGEAIHSETFTNQLTYQLSRRVQLSNTVSVGLNEDGHSYGFGAGVSIRSRIPITASYSYFQSDLSTGKRTRHLLRVDSIGWLSRNLNYILRNAYYIIDDAGHKNASEEKILSMQGDLFWSVNGYRINLGATYVKRSQTGGIDISTTMIRARIAKMLTRRLNVVAGIYYSSSSEDDVQTVFNSSLFWTFRQVVLSGEYELRKTSMRGGEDTTDHRLFLRVSRHFIKNYFMR